MRLAVAVVGICTVLTLLPELGSTKLGTGGMAAEASNQSAALSPGWSLTPGPPDYWTREFRRRWKAERADGKARASTIRELRRTLMVRAYRPIIEGVWIALARCESGNDWDYNGGSGFDGGLQFHPGTWNAYRRPWEPRYAYQAPVDVQVAVARRVLAAQGWGAWPACSRKLGLR